MTSTSSPGVIVNNIPVSWKRNGPLISQELLGSRTGKEQGACFWKVHPSLHKFMVVFKQKSDRDTWVNTSKLLKEKKEKHKLRVISVSYNRDKDIVTGEEKGVETFFERCLGAIPKAKVSKPTPSASSSSASKVKVEDKEDDVNVSRQSLDLLGSKFEDLDKLNPDVSQNLFDSFDQKSKTPSRTVPLAKPKKEDSPLEILRGLECLSFFKSPDHDRGKSAEDPNQEDMAKDKDLLNTSRSSNHSYNLRSRSVSPNVNVNLTNETVVKKQKVASKPKVHVKVVTEIQPVKSVSGKDVNDNVVKANQDPYFDLDQMKTGKVSTDSSLPRLMPSFDVPPPTLQNLADIAPPPLRQPNVGIVMRGSVEIMKSNILDKMRNVVTKMMLQDPDSKDKADSIARELVDSWRPHIVALEELYERHLGNAALNPDNLKSEIRTVYKFSGGSDLSKSKAVDLSAKFLVAAGSPQVEDSFQGQFIQHLKDNQSKYKVSFDEVAFILNRNGLDLLETFKDYTRNPSASGLKNLIQEKLNLGGNLYFEFSQILMDFFDERLTHSSTPRKLKKPIIANDSSQPSESGKLKQLKNDWTKISESITKKDLKKASQIAKEFSKKLNVVVTEASQASTEIKSLKEANATLESDLKLSKEDLKERMKSAQQENKVLRSRNSGLNEEAIDIKAKLDKTQSRLDLLCKILDTIAVGDDVSMELDNNNNHNEDLTLVLRALKSLKESNKKPRNDRTKGLTKVNVTVDGKKFVITTNRNNNIFAPDLEKLVGKKVEALSISQLLDDSKIKEFPVVNGYIESPTLGWSDRYYDVVTVNPHNHLGQGCTNTSGQRRLAIDVRGADGPIFPPHVAGPRICTG